MKKLYFTTADNQADILMGEFDTQKEAEDFVPTAIDELKSQESGDKTWIDEGSWDTQDA